MLSIYYIMVIAKRKGLYGKVRTTSAKPYETGIALILTGKALPFRLHYNAFPSLENIYKRKKIV